MAAMKGNYERTKHDPNRRVAYCRCDLLFRRNSGVVALELARTNVLLLATESVPRFAVLARLRFAVAPVIRARPAAAKRFVHGEQQ